MKALTVFPERAWCLVPWAADGHRRAAGNAAAVPAGLRVVIRLVGVWTDEVWDRHARGAEDLRRLRTIALAVHGESGHAAALTAYQLTLAAAH